MGICVKKIHLNILNMKTRIPFRFGIANMTVTPHLFVTAEISVDGASVKGMASEGLLPKWFTKNPDSTYRQEVDDMLAVIRSACDIAVGLGESGSIFGFWRELNAGQKEWAEARKIPGLLWGLGSSLVERAVIDGYCKAKKVSLQQALQKNMLGIVLGEVYEELDGMEPVELLGFEGVLHMHARHTVGLTDYLREKEIPEEDRVADGLPQSFEACVKEYGLDRYKIKLSGDIERDVARLTDISDIIRENGISEYAYTLDGNENFGDARDFVALWEKLTAHEALGDFLEKLIFVEQPVKRNAALSKETGEVFNRWKAKPPMIIDESDAEIGSVAKALERGYEGTSHKNCKGIIKGIANACLLKNRAAQNPGKKYLLSGEDLVNIGPVALLQDLAVSSLLGITHIERNGHHYFRGLSMYPREIQEKVLRSHGDLYKKHALGFAALSIVEGKISLASVLHAPFGSAIELDASVFTPAEKWAFESLYQ